MRTWRLGLGAGLVGALALAALIQGQAAPGGRAGGRRDPAAMRQGQLDRIKQSLEATDAEWQALKDPVEKVLTARQASTIRMAGRGGGPGGQPAGAEVSDAQKKATDLETTLANKDAKPEVIKAKLTAFREARDKAKQELADAQKALTELLSQRQEAQLVLQGLID